MRKAVNNQIATLQWLLTQLVGFSLYCVTCHSLLVRLKSRYLFLRKGLKKWVEVGNSGVFRPEMLLPMGLPEDVSVIAWGLSLER